ncbi:MAG TPA: acyl-CoA carboxylase epsilon subunit [Demequinaceae bacterium]
MNEQDDADATAAQFHVVRGHVDDDELAALVAGVVAYAAAASGEAETPGSPTSAWMDRSRSMRGRRVGILGRGENAWRHSVR